MITKSLEILFSTFFVCIYTLLLGIFYVQGGEFFFNSLVIIFLVYMAFIMLKLVSSGKLYSVYFFYILMSFFFMYDRLVFTLINPHKYNFLKVTFPVNIIFNKDIGISFLTLSFVHFFLMDLIYSFSQKKWNVKAISYTLINSDYNPILCKIGFYGMLLVLFPLLYKYYIQIQFIKQFPTYAIANFAYNGPGPVFPWWTKGTGTVFIISFLLFLYANPPQKKVKYAFFLYFIMQFGTSLKGGRGFFFCFILCIPLYYNMMFNKKFRIFPLVFIALICMFFAVFVEKFRTNAKFDINAGNILSSFLYGQGTTLGIPLIYLDKQNEIPWHNYPFIFSPIVNRIFSPGTEKVNIATLQKQNSMSEVLVYMLNPKLYFSGAGLGENFLTEIYDCGKYFGVFAWTIFFSFILKRLDKTKRPKGLYLCFLFYIYQCILFLPRSTFFGFLNFMGYIIELIAVLMVINFLFSYCFYKRSNSSNKIICKQEI